jgi:ubiquinone/menaquinone biosynthesis C-methylase UbiE
MQDEVKETKQFSARTYESPLFSGILGDTVHPGGLKLTARVAELAQIDKGCRILDIACGKGITACFLAQQYGCHVAGIDLSAELISLARDKAQSEGLSEKVDLLLGDGECLPCRDSLFDTVISECSFSILPNKEEAAVEIKRVLKPGHKLVITDIFLRSQVSEKFRTKASFAFCIAGAKTLEGYVKLFERVGFRDPYAEDHSEALKKVAYQALVSYGSWAAFSAQIWQTPASSSKEKDGDMAGKVWQNLFKQGRPGYALLAFTKPKE